MNNGNDMSWLKSIFDRRKKTVVASTPKPSPARYQIVQPHFEVWDESDVTALRTFFSSATGQKLIAICGSETLQQGMKEAAGDSLTRAAGMDFMLRFQFNLASDKELARISGATAAQAAKSPEHSQQDEVVNSEIRSF